MTNQMNDVEIGAPINGDASIDHHPTTTKSDTFVRERRIISSASFLPDKNTPIIRMKRKTVLVGKQNIVPFIYSPVHMRYPRELDGDLLLT